MKLATAASRPVPLNSSTRQDAPAGCEPTTSTRGSVALVSAPPPSGRLPAGQAANADVAVPARSGANTLVASEYSLGLLAQTTRIRKVVAPAVGLLTSTIHRWFTGNELASPIAAFEPETNAPPPSGTRPRGHSSEALVWAFARAMNESEVTTVRPWTAPWAPAAPSVESNVAATASAGRRRVEGMPRRYGREHARESVDPAG